MSSLEGISGQVSSAGMWSDIFQSWMGLLLVLGILLFGITGRIQYSCNPMVTGGDLPVFCSSTEVIEKIGSRPTHGDSINKIAADPNQNSNIALFMSMRYRVLSREQGAGSREQGAGGRRKYFKVYFSRVKTAIP